MIEIRLPFPPSVNGMFKNVPGRGRAPTKEYEAWKHNAGWELQAQRSRIPALASPVEIRIDLDERRRGDADNRTKAVLDLLVAHRIIRSDSKKYVKRVSIGWEVVTGCRVSIIPQIAQDGEQNATGN